MMHDFVTNSSNIFQFDDHGTEVFSIMAAEVVGTFTPGVAQADFLLFVTEDVSTEYRIEEYNWLFAAEKSDSAGADVIQSSLGYNTFDNASMNYTTANLDGKTAVISGGATGIEIDQRGARQRRRARGAAHQGRRPARHRGLFAQCHAPGPVDLGAGRRRP